MSRPLLINPATYAVVTDLHPHQVRELILAGRVRSYVVRGRRVVAWLPQAEPRARLGVNVRDETAENKRGPSGFPTVLQWAKGGVNAQGPGSAHRQRNERTRA